MSNKNGKIIRFPGALTVRNALEDALQKADDMKGIIIIGVSNTEKDGKEYEEVHRFVGGTSEFSDPDALWLLKKFEFELMHMALEMEYDDEEY